MVKGNFGENFSFPSQWGPKKYHEVQNQSRVEQALLHCFLSGENASCLEIFDATLQKLTTRQVDQKTIFILNVCDSIHQADGSTHAGGQIDSIASRASPLTGLGVASTLVSDRNLKESSLSGICC